MTERIQSLQVARFLGIRRSVVRKWASRVIVYTLLSGLGLAFALPFIWMVSTSLKTDAQVYTVPPVWIPNPVRLMNYPEALTAFPFGRYVLNTLRFAIPSTIGTLLSCTLVAYSFSRIEWPGRDALFYICLATMMIPFQVRMIPMYILFSKLGWVNSYKSLVIPRFFGDAYYIFLLRQFFMTIPRELSDAARVDGCSELGIFLRIILPLSVPALVVVGMFRFMWAWNNYLGPLIFLNKESLYPVALGLQQFRGSYGGKLVWPYLMAASVATMMPIPVLFFFLQKKLVGGITMTGLKG